MLIILNVEDTDAVWGQAMSSGGDGRAAAGEVAGFSVLETELVVLGGERLRCSVTCARHPA
jgi:hypothetical protein